MSALRQGPKGTAPRLPPPTWRWWEGVLVFLAGYLVGDLLGDSLLPPLAPATARVTGQALVELAWTVAILLWLRARHPGWLGAMGRPARPLVELREGAVLGFIVYGVVALAVVLPLDRLLRPIADGQVRPDQLPSSLPPVGLAVALLFSLVIAPVAEELFFRGVLFRALRDRHGFAVGAAGSAIAFGLVHLVPTNLLGSGVIAVGAAAMGVGLAVVYERRQNILAPTSAHVAFNLLGLVVLFVRA